MSPEKPNRCSTASVTSIASRLSRPSCMNVVSATFSRSVERPLQLLLDDAAATAAFVSGFTFDRSNSAAAGGGGNSWVRGPKRKWCGTNVGVFARRVGVVPLFEPGVDRLARSAPGAASGVNASSVTVTRRRGAKTMRFASHRPIASRRASPELRGCAVGPAEHAAPQPAGAGEHDRDARAPRRARRRRSARRRASRTRRARAGRSARG